MNKVLTVILTLLIAASAWAGPAEQADMEARFRQATIARAVEAQEMPLGDFLDIIGARSGVTITAVPAVADIRVTLSLAAGLTPEQVLQALTAKYGITYTVNGRGVIVTASGHRESAWNMPAAYSGAAYPETYIKVAAAVPSPRPLYGGGSAVPVFNTEEYRHLPDNRMQEALQTPVSTFSVDVDTASYSNMRRFLNNGRMPPADAVRTEEMVNYFTYDYPQPQDAHPFSVTAEVGECPWQPGNRLLMIGLQGKTLSPETLPPGNFVFLIDVSGSMAPENRLPLLKSAFKLLVRQLRPQDRVAIVVYAGAAGVVLESTPGSEKDKIIRAIDGLRAGGSTAGGEGIRMAYRLARGSFLPEGNNRVILATDGDFNVGVSSEGELVRMIEQERRDGIYLSILGVGMGNVKDNKMEALADRGNGNYAYIDSLSEARKVLVSQFAGTMYALAKDVKLQVEFNPAKVLRYRLIGYENRMLDRADFNDDRRDAGEMGAGHSVTALYEIVPAGSASQTGTDDLAFQRAVLIPGSDLARVQIRYKRPGEEVSTLMEKRVGADGGVSDNFRFAAAVAEAALLLRNSEYKGQASYGHVLQAARAARGGDRDGYRAEFIRLMEVARILDPQSD